MAGQGRNILIDWQSQFFKSSIQKELNHCRLEGLSDSHKFKVSVTLRIEYEAMSCDTLKKILHSAPLKSSQGLLKHD